MEANSEAYSEPCQTSKMEVFGKIVNGFSFLIIFGKSSILDVFQDSEFASEASHDLWNMPHPKCLTGFWTHLCINYCAKLLLICLLNLINIFHHISSNTVLCTVKSTWPCVQHICLITKIEIVLPNHVFL